MSRCLHRGSGEVYINFTVDRTTAGAPIAIDVYQAGDTRPLNFRCRNDSIPGVLKVVFKSCVDLVVILNETATVNLSVEANVTYMDMICNQMLIGPQREYPCNAYIYTRMLLQIIIPASLAPPSLAS